MINTNHGSPVLRVPANESDLHETVATTGVTVLGVGPTGIGPMAPLVTATIDGQTAFYPSCSRDELADIAASLAEGTLPTDSSSAIVEHDPDTATMPAVGFAGFDVGARRVLAGAGWRRPTAPTDHEAAGGFVDVDPSEILEHAMGLLGRGWGDWSHDTTVGDAWQRATDTGGKTATDDSGTAIVVNAHGTRADALLCESVPFEVLEGAQLAARAATADRVVVFCSADDGTAVERVREASDAYPDPTAPIEVLAGPPTHRATEPTMALEAIEGNHRLEARLRLPDGTLPTLDGKPSLVHTARTYAQLAAAVRTGEESTTRLVTVSGDVEDPATVELPADATLARAVDAVTLEGQFKAACVGGRFGGLTDSLDVGVAPGALTTADLGTEGSLEVLTDDRCILSFVGNRTEFAADANCGRCVPCREGSKQLAESLRDVYDGDVDRDGIEELIRTMTGASACEFGVVAGRPARTALQSFEAEVRAHADGRCPAGTCPNPAEVSP